MENNLSLPTIVWLPQYIIKKHSRAKCVKLMVTNARCLKITIPPHFNIKNLPAMLEKHKTWIVKQLEKFPPITCELPKEILFHAVNESWKVYYISCEKKFEIIQRPNYEIVMMGNMKDKKFCRNKLVDWVKKISRDYLISQLEKISQITELPYERVFIRNQATVWGSCTSKKNISLNYALIFLPSALASYVMIHELCHTKFLNHSRKFWNLVAIYDQNWQAHRRALRHGNNFIPDWSRL